MPLLSRIWIVNGKAHSKFTIPNLKQFFLSLSTIGQFLLSLFPIGWYLNFSLGIRIAKNTPISHITIHIMKVSRQSPMRIHDVAGKSAIRIIKALSLLLSATLQKMQGSAGIMNVEFKVKMCFASLLSTFMREAANSNRFGSKRLRTSKACTKIKGHLQHFFKS